MVANHLSFELQDNLHGHAGVLVFDSYLDVFVEMEDCKVVESIENSEENVFELHYKLFVVLTDVSSQKTLCRYRDNLFLYMKDADLSKDRFEISGLLVQYILFKITEEVSADRLYAQNKLQKEYIQLVLDFLFVRGVSYSIFTNRFMCYTDLMNMEWNYGMDKTDLLKHNSFFVKNRSELSDITSLAMQNAQTKWDRWLEKVSRKPRHPINVNPVEDLDDKYNDSTEYEEVFLPPPVENPCE